ncbi:MAG: DUF4136 domain-containing protein [Bacteroidia bacterium]|jgi:hypothetical protein|nr:DUF4136 domain-containing protein [Bacteroidia bacterium]
MNYKKLLSLATITLVLFSGCRPGGAEYISDLDVVGTAYTKEIDFSTRKTYAMWDSIVQITSDQPEPGEDRQFVSQTYASIVTSEIDRQMKALGWTKVDRNQNPDAYIQNASMQNTYVYYYYSYYYYGYYYPYSGWYYPGYYPPTYSSTTTGTLLMMLIDAKTESTSPNGTQPVLWVGVINGLMEGSTSSFTSRVSSNVGQAFKQSPILKR